MFHLVHHFAVAGFVIVVPQYGISSQRSLDLRQGSHQRSHILAAFVIVATHQQDVGMQGRKQPYQIGQPLLFQQTLVMQIGNEGNPATVKSLGNIAMSEIVHPHTLHPFVRRRDINRGKRNLCAPFHDLLLPDLQSGQRTRRTGRTSRHAANVPQIGLVERQHSHKRSRQSYRIGPQSTVRNHFE